MRFLWNLASDDPATDISVEARDCKRSRLRRSRCEKCVEVCPTDMIALDNGPRIMEGCVDCGLCIAACPTGAFRKSPDTDHHLVSLMQILRARPKPTGTEGTLVIRCHFAQRKRRHLITVSCLGVISEFSMVIAAALGFREIRLLQGDCSRCRLRPGELLFDKSLDTTRMLLNDLGLSKVLLRVDQKHRRDAVNRRQFLSGITNRPRINSMPSLEHVEDLDRCSPQPDLVINDEKNQPDKRRLLIDLLREKLTAAGRFAAPLWWWKLQIDAARCSACGVCALVCPRGAISEERNSDHQLIRLDASRCTNCGLCIEACPDNAVTFGEPVHLSDCVDGKWEQLVKTQLHSCLVCGDTITSTSTGRCTTCDRRQIYLVC
jgi:ferredoxin